MLSGSACAAWFSSWMACAFRALLGNSDLLLLNAQLASLIGPCLPNLLLLNSQLPALHSQLTLLVGSLLLELPLLKREAQVGRQPRDIGFCCAAVVSHLSILG